MLIKLALDKQCQDCAERALLWEKHLSHLPQEVMPDAWLPASCFVYSFFFFFFLAWQKKTSDHTHLRECHPCTMPVAELSIAACLQHIWEQGARRAQPFIFPLCSTQQEAPVSREKKGVRPYPRAGGHPSLHGAGSPTSRLTLFVYFFFSIYFSALLMSVGCSGAVWIGKHKQSGVALPQHLLAGWG